MNVLHKKINCDFSDSLNVHSFSYIMFVMSTIKYPNAISTINTMHQKSYSSRGMRLENDINDSNKYYRELDRALIYKKPTPVQVVAEYIHHFYQLPRCFHCDDLHWRIYVTSSQ